MQNRESNRCDRKIDEPGDWNHGRCSKVISMYHNVCPVAPSQCSQLHGQKVQIEFFRSEMTLGSPTMAFQAFWNPKSEKKSKFIYLKNIENLIINLNSFVCCCYQFWITIRIPIDWWYLGKMPNYCLQRNRSFSNIPDTSISLMCWRQNIWQ